MVWRASEVIYLLTVHRANPKLRGAVAPSLAYPESLVHYAHDHSYR